MRTPRSQKVKPLTTAMVSILRRVQCGHSLRYFPYMLNNPARYAFQNDYLSVNKKAVEGLIKRGLLSRATRQSASRAVAIMILPTKLGKTFKIDQS